MNNQLKRLYETQKEQGLAPANFKINGKITQTFKYWNLKQLKEGNTLTYADPDYLFSPTGGFQNKGYLIKKKYDTRFNTKIEKDSFKTKYPNRQGSTIITKEGDKEITYDPSKYVVVDGQEQYDGQPINNFGYWYKLIKEFQGKQIRIIVKYYGITEPDSNIYEDGEFQKTYREFIQELQQQFNGSFNFVLDTIIDLDENYTKKKYDLNKDYNRFVINSDYPNLLAYLLEFGVKCKVIITTQTQLNQRVIFQSFSQGDRHCLLSPIEDWAINKYNTAKENSSTQKRYKTILNTLRGKVNKTKENTIGYLEKYSQGIPERDLQEVVDNLQIEIEIEQPFKHEPYINVRSIKKPLKKFHYVNSRLNHVESYITKSYDDLEEERYTPDELLELSKKLKEKGIHFIFSRNNYGITSIQTKDAIYKVYTEYEEIVKEFEKTYNFKQYSIDGLKNMDLQHFINYGTHFNGTIDFQELPNINDPNVEHYDIEKAYIQFEKSKYYNGFLGKITDFRRVDNYDEKGYYYIVDLNTTHANEKFKFFNGHLKWFNNHNIYTDAELRFLHDQGCKFNVKAGAYGTSFKFKFSEEMKQKETYKTIKKVVNNELVEKEVKISHYAKWVGKCASISRFNRYHMYGSQQYFENLSNEHNNIYYDEYREEATINYKKKTLHNLKHIAGQITAYQRLIMIEQLFKMDHTKIIRVCVDGVYTYKHNFERDEIFRKKEDKTFKNSPCVSYLSNIFTKEEDIIFTPKMNRIKIGNPRPFYKTELWLGQGGTGKTYINIRDWGTINGLYIAPSWKLARAVEEDIKGSQETNKTIGVSVKHRVLNMEFSDKLQQKYNVFLWDEASQLLEREKEYIINHIEGKHIFMGDLGYQLEPVVNYKELKIPAKDGKYYEMTSKGIDNVITLTTDRRAEKCKELQELKLELRNYIKQGKKLPIQERHTFRLKVINKIKEILPSTTLETMEYQPHDLILASKHEFKDEYSEKFKHLEKYLVENNTRDYSNSQIIFHKPPEGVKAKITHGFTIHAIQGETIKPPNKLYIDLRNFFSDRMLYTAISRAKEINQITLII